MAHRAGRPRRLGKNVQLIKEAFEARNVEAPPRIAPFPSPPTAKPRRSLETLECPYCARDQLVEADLWSHIKEQHADDDTKVVCPVCANMPGGDATYKRRDMHEHVQRRHLKQKKPARRTVETVFIGSPCHKLWRQLQGSPAMWWNYLVQADIATAPAEPEVLCNICECAIKTRGILYVLDCGHVMHNKCLPSRPMQQMPDPAAALLSSPIYHEAQPFQEEPEPVDMPCPCCPPHAYAVSHADGLPC